MALRIVIAPDSQVRVVGVGQVRQPAGQIVAHWARRAGMFELTPSIPSIVEAEAVTPEVVHHCVPSGATTTVRCILAGE